jgi:hypothetical protein
MDWPLSRHRRTDKRGTEAAGLDAGAQDVLAAEGNGFTFPVSRRQRRSFAGVFFPVSTAISDGMIAHRDFVW